MLNNKKKTNKKKTWLTPHLIFFIDVNPSKLICTLPLFFLGFALVPVSPHSQSNFERDTTYNLTTIYGLANLEKNKLGQIDKVILLWLGFCQVVLMVKTSLSDMNLILFVSYLSGWILEGKIGFLIFDVQKFVMLSLNQIL